MQMSKKFSVEPENNFKRISVIMGDKNTFRHPPGASIMVDLYFFHNKKSYTTYFREGGYFESKCAKIICTFTWAL